MKVKAIARNFVMCSLLFLFATPAYSIFYQWGGEKIIKIMDLPDSSTFQRPDGKYIDVGYRYQQFTILFIPVWNYNEKWCGYIGSDKEYIDFDKGALSEFAGTAGLKLPDNPSLPLWDSVGGKLLFGLILTLLHSKKILSSADKKEVAVKSQGVRKGCVKKSV